MDRDRSKGAIMNEYLDRILQAYLKTCMNEKQFEALVSEALTAAEERGKQQAGYDKGFSDGYESCLAENELL